MNPRVVSVSAAVVAIHVALLAVVLVVRNESVPRALESHTITAELLSPAPVAAPVAIQSTPTPPKPVPPVPHAKPKVQLKPTPKPTPAPLPEAAAPAQHEISTPEPAPAAHAAPAPPALAAPKNVSHLDCGIVQPDYPALSKRRGETGTAAVKFVVGLTGKIESIELKKSSGYSRLDDAALAAMHASACKPYLENGEPVRATYTQPFVFGLTD